MLAKRLQNIKPSATLAINARAIEMQKQGIDVLKFGTGEPDFDTPDFIKEAAKKAIDEGFTKYTATGGIKELKTAICTKLKRDNAIECVTENVIVTAGGKQALYNLFMVLLNPGDEVIVPSPYWVSYADMIHLAEGKVVTIDTSDNVFKITAEKIQAVITHKTKAIILNSPSNPTGAVIEKMEIEKIAALAQQHDFMIVSDEVYEYFLYDDVKHFSIGSIPELKNRVFTVNAVSKTYSMTGWRLGYLAGPVEYVKAMDDLQGHSTSNPSSISQKAALAALTGPQDSVVEMRNEFARRRDYVYETMNQIPGFKLLKPEGAFYAFPKITSNDSFKFCELLLEKAHVALVPGAAFGEEGEGHLRLSYAASMDDLKEGLRRINSFMNNG